VTVPGEFKAWTIFQKDSYWIYLNETTNQTDSTFVTDCHESFYNHGDQSGDYYTEDYRIQLSSKFLNYFWIYAGEDDYTTQEISTYHLTEYILSMRRLKNPFAHENLTGSIKSKVVEVLPTLQFNSNTYTNVYNILVYYQKLDGDSVNDNFYLAKNIGLIKYKTKIGNADTTWSLLRYHVIQQN
jgi:hypothetical protein